MANRGIMKCFNRLIIIGIHLLIIEFILLYRLIVRFEILAEEEDYRNTFIKDKINNEKWVVMETGGQVTERQVQALSHYSDWTFLILSGKELINHDRCKIVIVFNQNFSRTLYETDEVTNNQELCRNQAYLIAIKAGARFIFDASQNLLENPYIDLESIANQHIEEYMELMVNGTLYDAMDHYGSILRNMKYRRRVNSYKIVKARSPAVNQAIFSGNRLLDSNRALGIPRLIVLPSGQLSFISGLGTVGTMFRFEAFWGLFRTRSRHSVMYRSLWLQRLLEASGRHRYGYFKMFWKPEESYDEGNRRQTVFEEMAKKLLRWKCEFQMFDACMKRLGEKLEQTGYWNYEDLKSLFRWIYSLKELKYFRKIQDLRNVDGELLLADDIIYYPPVYSPELTGDKNPEVSTTTRGYYLGKVKRYCSRFNYTEMAANMPWTSYKEILLIVSFNRNFPGNILLLDSMYGYKFPNLIYCAPDHPETIRIAKENRISYVKTPWFKRFNDTSVVSNCFVAAARMRFNVDGLLHVSDDVLLNHWNFRGYDRAKIWTTHDAIRQPFVADAKSKVTFDANLRQVGQVPKWISRFGCESGLIDAYDEMSSSRRSTLIDCHRKLVVLLKGRYRYYFGQADIFYVPARLMDSFAELLRVFTDNEVIFEIAVPTVLRCLSDDMLILRWNHKDGKKRRNVTANLYRRQMAKPYYHPFKFSLFVSDDRIRENVFCNLMIPEYFSR